MVMESAADLDQNQSSDLQDSLRQDVLRAVEAEKLIKNDLLSQAFADVDADLIERWKKTDLFDAETREAIWREVKILGSLKAKLENHIRTGEVAKANLQRMSLMQRLRGTLT